MDAPAWFKQLQWSSPLHVAALNQDRGQISPNPGCYAFTIGPVTLAPGRVLYIGEAAGQALRDRLPVYLVDFRKSRPGGAPKGKAHKGKGFILEARDSHGDQGVFCRWVEYGGSTADIHILEASLINYLNPAANDREEEGRHPLLGDKERLNPQLL